jgi:hypothetical protein
LGKMSEPSGRRPGDRGDLGHRRVQPAPTPARARAAGALHHVFAKGGRVPEGWNAGLSPEDARLAQAVLGLCLRRWGRLNAW